MRLAHMLINPHLRKTLSTEIAPMSTTPLHRTSNMITTTHLLRQHPTPGTLLRPSQRHLCRLPQQIPHNLRLLQRLHIPRHPRISHCPLRPLPLRCQPPPLFLLTTRITRPSFHIRRHPPRTNPLHVLFRKPTIPTPSIDPMPLFLNRRRQIPYRMNAHPIFCKCPRSRLASAERARQRSSVDDAPWGVEAIPS
jgi:hypothetical protein